MISTFDKSDIPIFTHSKDGPFLVSLITINLLKFSPSTLFIKNSSTFSLGIFTIPAAE